MGLRPITPFVGFNPASPQKAAGIRTEPPPSDPVAMGASPAARAAPEPPLDPPGDQSSAHGFRVGPKRRFAVNPSVSNSGTLVLPTTIAPAARSRETTSPSAPAGGGGGGPRRPRGRPRPP